MPAQLKHIRTDSLIRPTQVRKFFDEAARKRLLESVRTLGIQQPILVRMVEGRPEVIDGARRARAAEELGLETVPALVLDNPMEIAEVLVRQLSANLHREDLSAVDRAMGIYTLMQTTGMAAEQAADKLCLSPATVSKMLRILDLPEPIREQVAAGAISADAAYHLARIKDKDARGKLADRVAKGELTRDDLAAEVKQFETGKPLKPKPPTWRMTRSIGPGVALAVSGSTLTLERLAKCLEGFIAKAKAAAEAGMPLVAFLSQFNHSSSGEAEVSP